MQRHIVQLSKKGIYMKNTDTMFVICQNEKDVYDIDLNIDTIVNTILIDANRAPTRVGCSNQNQCR